LKPYRLPWIDTAYVAPTPLGHPETSAHHMRGIGQRLPPDFLLPLPYGIQRTYYLLHHRMMFHQK
jgi:hypothetical protein